GLSLLFPNLPPKPAIINLPPLHPSIKLFTPNPISFNSHHQPLQPIHNHTLTQRHVLLITYHPPNPPPPIPQILPPTSSILARPLPKHVPLITDPT
uniref:dihydroxy-acid dehydratase domain-containing protein n=1 Tax=Staphylococcus epidermidis TaxID=1282 RepID=UPI001642FD98